ncbi:hypothetical protein KUL72_32590 [Bradyrhizobium arachidis]|uniref:hypothetical protein n=1 Tax=Bradyrhizobium arachidis TaxID=858423 RepID=UPI002161FC59|nr:hypothetical protein [Bradyrhizobium arachidis]UVO35976.1 hypothetical protein KUL72_32590 [Bradyrhizobium arachidis]
MREVTAEQRDNRVLMPTGIHGPDLDEDLSVEGTIEGRPAAPRPLGHSWRPVARSLALPKIDAPRIDGIRPSTIPFRDFHRLTPP